ncbi:MAG: nicotinate-nucleotide adenylyltransferase [Gammaproteobacteria bacterium]|nr:nicotinate-nucleotide adenylyltransferase [Gammaproteobacteria bacterium]
MTVNRFIGLLGGTFDPIHYGHLQPARLAKQQLGFDELRLLPCHLPVHRDQPTASAQQRVQMLELALKEFPELILDMRELKRNSPSYSFDTLNTLHAECPDARFCWLLGLDAFRDFNHWYRWRQVLSLTNLLVIQRPGWSLDLADELEELLQRHRVDDIQTLRQSPAGAVLIYELNAPDISSTQIRERLARSESIQGLLPKAVEEWLAKNPVYLKKELCK